MTKTAIKRAFQGLDATTQAEVLRELADSLAKSLADMDAQDGGIMKNRRIEEDDALPFVDVKRRLTKRRKR